ncbi:hypothetical protein HAX54_033469 [Datura stramonium]|uniref:Uncharacterized protein n=1 Tax=Datura stramonium TaxID=4076 RepID=A0ABS8VFF6_DATST|nr:hypothetical protein [Datura stramonium]
MQFQPYDDLESTIKWYLRDDSTYGSHIQDVDCQLNHMFYTSPSGEAIDERNYGPSFQKTVRMAPKQITKKRSKATASKRSRLVDKLCEEWQAPPTRAKK